MFRSVLSPVVVAAAVALVASGCASEKDTVSGSAADSKVTAKAEDVKETKAPKSKTLAEAGVTPAVKGGPEFSQPGPITGGNIPKDTDGQLNEAQVVYLQFRVNSFQIKEVPDVTVGKHLNFAEFKSAMTSCLTEKGWTDLWWSGSIPDTHDYKGKRTQFETDAIACWGEYPLASKYLHEHNKAQRQALFTYRSTTLMECLKAEGHNPPKPPATLAEYEKGKQKWNPLASVGLKLDTDKALALAEKCPISMPVDELYSDELLSASE